MLFQTSTKSEVLSNRCFATCNEHLPSNRHCQDCTVPKLSGTSAADTFSAGFTMAISGLGYLPAKNI